MRPLMYRYVHSSYLILIICLNQSSCSFYLPSTSNLDRAANSLTWSQDEDFQKLLDEKTKSTQLPANSALLLVNGVESFARRYENIRTAEFIYVKTFLFTDDEAGRRMASALSDRARAGIPVVLQYDVKGSIESPAVITDCTLSK